jgi:polysaccharide export outer membrane protein
MARVRQEQPFALTSRLFCGYSCRVIANEDTMMKTTPISSPTSNQRGARRGWRALGALALLLTGLAVFTGCQQPAQEGSAFPPSALPAAPDPAVAVAQAGGGGVLSAGDTIKVTFALETNLNTVVKIQLDGLVPLPLVGEVPAAGLTAQALKTNLTERYQRFLKGDEVTVSLAASTASVYVTGAVLRPGRIAMDRPWTALEAIMEAGGFDIRANTTTVTVLRLENGRQQTHKVNLRDAMQGRDTLPFWLKPFDIVRVSERVINF